MIKDGKKIDENVKISDITYSPDGKSIAYIKEDTKTSSDDGYNWDDVLMKDGVEVARYYSMTEFYPVWTVYHTKIKYLSYSKDGKSLNYVVRKTIPGAYMISCTHFSPYQDVFVENGIERHLA